jgi:hypothetical protein
MPAARGIAIAQRGLAIPQKNKPSEKSVFITWAAIPALADNQEIAGWRDAKWGMSPEAVQSVLKYPTRNADLSKVCGDKCGEGAALELDNYELNGHNFLVRFWFTKNDVHLHTISMYAREQNPDATHDLFGSMKDYYQKEYGAPQAITLKSGYFIISWALPVTRITLYSNTTNEMTVVYQAAKEGETANDGISEFNTHWVPFLGPAAGGEQ